MKIELGWVPLNSEGQPHRPSRSGYSWQVGLTNPPRIYTTQGRAEGQSPVGKAAQVFMELE